MPNNIDSTILNWHNRLGHMNLKPLAILLKNMNISIPIASIKHFKCSTCLLAKDNRYIHKKSLSSQSWKIGERIHSDLGGPITPKTYNNYIYYITFLDKKSRYLWVYLLRNKNEAYIVFKQFRPLIKNQTNNNIKELFTDNGKEYINKTFKIYIDAYSIIHRKTPIYTKEPNGLIERINLTLLNKVRAMLLYSGLPNYLWGEAILAACYIYNRTPHSAIDLKTPYEAYNGIKPNISNIKI